MRVRTHKKSRNMKRILNVLVALPLLWGGVACSDNKTDEEPPVNNQKAVCAIEAPADGAEVDAAEPLKIKGSGSVDNGSIRTVTLTVDGRTIEEVTEVPFEYDYTIEEDRPAGDLKIELTIEGDRGARATSTVSVKVKAAEPEPSSIVCFLTAPADGTEVDMSEPLTIAGEVQTENCAVKSVTLTVDGTPIAEVTAIPFEYAYTFAADRAEGSATITLTVESDKGGSDSQEVTVMLKRPAPQPDNTFTDPRDGKVYKTVVIGEQTWMAENLAWLPKVNNIDEQASLESLAGKQFYYVLYYNGNDVEAAKATQEYAKYGVLYNWYAAVGEDNAAGGDKEAVPSGVQGACPDGWHLPSTAEWQQMETYVAAQQPDVRYLGRDEDWNDVWYEDGRNVWAALSAVEGWGEIDETFTNKYPDLLNGAKDVYGFGAAPSGRYTPSRWDEVQDFETVFKFNDGSVYFWATHNDSYGGGSLYLTNTQYSINYVKGGYQASYGQSVRCVKD